MWESFSGAAASPAVRAAYRQLYPGIYLAKGDSRGAGEGEGDAGEDMDMDGDRATSLGELSVQALGALGEIAGRFNRDDKVKVNVGRKGGDVRRAVSGGGGRAETTHTTHGGQGNGDEKGEDQGGMGGMGGGGRQPQNRFADIHREEEGGETMEARSERSKAAFEGRVRRQQEVNRLYVYRL